MRQRKQILDGRGSSTVLYIDRRPMPRPDGVEKTRERRLRGKVLRVVFGAYMWKAAAALAVMLLGAFAFGRFSGPLIGMLRDMGVSMFLAGIFAVVPYLLVLVVIYFAMRPARYAIALVFIEGRICPSCLYDLENLPPHVDDCTVCPECGGAWRLDPVPSHSQERDSA